MGMVRPGRALVRKANHMKPTLWRRTKVKLAALCTAGVVFGSVPGDLGCTSFFVENQIGSLDFCFLLNCNDGALGGLFDFCAPINFTSFVGGGNDAAEGTFLSDCPDG